MKCIDTYKDILKIAGRMKGNFDRPLWQAYIHSISLALLDKLEEDSRDYDYESQVLPVLNHALQNPEAIETAHKSFLRATEGLDEKLILIPI